MQVALTYNEMIAFAQCCAAASSTTMAADFINQMSALQVSKAGPSTGGLKNMKEWLFSYLSSVGFWHRLLLAWACVDVVGSL